MKPTANQACVAIIAGEASGDLHGAKLISAMQKRDSTLFFCGIGGPCLKQAGMRILVEASELTVVGITEVFGKLPVILRALGTIRKLLTSLKPGIATPRAIHYTCRTGIISIIHTFSVTA